MDRNIEIHIDRIVLDGVGHLDKAELSAAVHEHLMAKVSEQGLPPRLLNSGYHRKLNGGEMNLTAQPKKGQVGSDIAGGIMNGINGIL